MSDASRLLRGWATPGCARTAKDEAEAVRWFRKGAEGGYVRAMGNLGIMMSDGVLGTARDDVEAVRWLSKSAEGGDSIATGYVAGCAE